MGSNENAVKTNLLHDMSNSEVGNPNKVSVVLLALEEDEIF